MTHPADQLSRAILEKGTAACVGIDPDPDRLPERVRTRPGCHAEDVRTFCLGVIDAVADVVGVVKPQSACFERFGSLGYGVLEDVVARARERGLVVILDAKRGDIDSSAAHYAHGAAAMGAHWITVSPYMGPSTIEPFLEAGLGVFALCRTSNADSGRLQALDAGGRTLAERTGEMLAEMGQSRMGACGLSAVGAVVGATRRAGEVARLRALMPDTVFLAPGFGAQGGTLAELSPMRRPGASDAAGLGVVVNASRSVLYPKPVGADWQAAVRTAALDLVRDLSALEHC
ncbi:MAG: orotidine-5'-phosphate decarboxylase [Leptolyngbya sp. PLA3]|nr:MAG: orotidine-5'-phosphate decarboxylase [Cyanobacteria bacterium CYA]MCE7968571.1 orotidine-5'-phosphate decarboxylase [Leptolyngbya sp. PL-A3]